MVKDDKLVIDISEGKLREIVSKSVGSQMQKHGLKKPEWKSDLTEAYVSEPKPFKQATDMVSQRTKDGHTELYHNYVDSLNKSVNKIDSLSRSDINNQSSEFKSAKLDETYNLNGKWLHELYFANCFDPNSEIYGDSKAFLRLSKEFGDFDRWQKDFIACALSAGEGWAVCGYHMHLQRYVNTFVTQHSQDVMMGVYPLVVLDMWSHAYHRDYIIDKKSYIVAMMREFNWNVIEDRFEIVEKLGAALR